MDKKNEVIHISVQQRIDNYKEAYAKAKEAALACREVAFPRLLAMEALWAVSYTHLTLPTTPYV